MLSSYSWQHFFLAAAIALLLYYLVILLLFYRSELKSLLTGRRQTAPLPEDDILGPALPDQEIPLFEASAIRVAPASREEAAQPDPVADLPEEIRPLVELARETQADKDEFIELLRLTTARYRNVAGSRQAVNRFLLEQDQGLPFALSPADLAQLWDAPEEGGQPDQPNTSSHF